MSHSSRLLRDMSTPFDSVKTAPQKIEFAIDPSFGLTRKRYGWFSNGSLFDDTHFSTVPGGINIQTSANGTDTARLQSSYAGQYVSQSLGVPGQGLHIDRSNVSISGGEASLSHGIVAVGAGWHDGSTGGWDVGGTIDTFIGLLFTADGVFAAHVSGGSHIGDSPVPQSEWSEDPLNGTGDTGNVLDPAYGYIYNQPYTWYNEGGIQIGYVDPEDDTYWAAHHFPGRDGAPNLDTPNLPTMVVIDNDGTGSELGVTVGGMQYSRYGSETIKDATRKTPVSRITPSGYIAQEVVTTANAVDPNTPGNPIVAVQREDGQQDLELQSSTLSTKVTENIYLMAWDEFAYDQATGTDSNMRPPHTVNGTKETKVLVDTEVTSYTPTKYTFRGYVPIEGGQEKKVPLQNTDVEDRVPIGATRVYTAVHRGTAAAITAMRLNMLEGF